MFKQEKLWVAPAWEALLSNAGLLDIEALTTRELDWFEQPNKRMGGWSGVSRIILNPDAPEPERVAVFLKIQNNHCYRTIGNLMKKRLTFEREMDAYQGLAATNLLPELMLFAKWSQDGDIGSIMITKALDGFVEFEDGLEQIKQTHAEPEAEIRKALAAVANATRAMHGTGWGHFTHKPKHVFIGAAKDGGYSVRFIDFERARRPLRAKTLVTQDLAKFLRHSPVLNREQKLQFLHDYFQTEAFNSTQLKWIHALEKSKSL